MVGRIVYACTIMIVGHILTINSLKKVRFEQKWIVNVECRKVRI